jgi:hypothetical protein
MPRLAEHPKKRATLPPWPVKVLCPECLKALHANNVPHAWLRLNRHLTSAHQGRKES